MSDFKKESNHHDHDHGHDHHHEHNHDEEVEFITVIDEFGKEQRYNILFTFDSDDFGKSYVLVYPEDSADDDQIELQAFSYIEQEGSVGQGELSPIETDEEWDMVEEVLNTFLSEDELN
ncbi:MAG: DUF1292 domain-containing protein [Bavariicoccus seileri]|uniref:DUF1292 domain-containing protein n=1 Tax=Bavariicoccus seileri TaxID=549685 RepID=UPI003F9B969C